ncbi:MAG: hypothetical protein EBS48_11415 [Actinobacteria bacterium]|nr:hypothetical protein [Actinomycetota bacterium]NBR66187.1 hypothetical protein [Actinomycetota bacterium]NBU17592.1 hypothetical protein [Actinomycetota bacterium]
MTAVAFLPVMFTVLACISGSLLLVLVYLDNRNSRIDDSIDAFRRHIDALSPESRRNSVLRGPEDGPRR